ncbi:MAG: carboxypeptidase regulatory-like domain-containing protein [Planctomycetales bacterium]|nr:carboxypeptidase regulatory-like domain-containing protein [Planctomycetales bacterium]
MSKLALLPLFLFALAVGGAASLLLRRRLRFSLRWLLFVSVMVGLVLGGVTWWQTAGHARLQRVDPASPDALAWRPEPVIVERKDKTTGSTEYAARFMPHYRSIHQLVDLPEVAEARASAKDETSGSFGVTYYHTEQQVIYESSSRAELEAVLKTVEAADVPRPDLDESVIFGVVVDSNGDPVGGATIDLLGPSVYINNFITRDDGTFHMPNTAPAGRGYYLRVRYGDGRSMRTSSFHYDGPGSELGVRVTVD